MHIQSHEVLKPIDRERAKIIGLLMIACLGFVMASLFRKKKQHIENFCLHFKTFKESLLLPIFCHSIPTGAKACKELRLYEEAIKWCSDGLAVSFTDAITNICCLLSNYLF